MLNHAARQLGRCKNSVLQEWVMDLPRRHQGVLVCGVRGCDLAPKFPLDSYERKLTAAIRGHVLNPADPREVDSEPGSFMSMQIPVDLKVSSLVHYPQHWVSHVMHACQVLAAKHPDEEIASQWAKLYMKFCDAFHVAAESISTMDERLMEDRIAKGTVVS